MNRQLRQHFDSNTNIGLPQVGLTFHQMLGSVLQWMGVPKTQWGGPMNGGEPNHGGYGYRPPRLTARQDAWREAEEWRVAGETLPFLTV
jgi:hypothetical protein